MTDVLDVLVVFLASLASLQPIPDPSTFAAADSWGVPAALLFCVAVLGYVLYRSGKALADAEQRRVDAEHRCEEIQERLEDALEKYEGVLLEDLRHYKERDRTLDLIAQSKGASTDA